jgi:acetolactate synthase-1/2/3 large subunit
MLDIDRPDLGWVEMAKGMGVPSARIDTCEGLMAEMQRGLVTQGPYLIEAVL